MIRLAAVLLFALPALAQIQIVSIAPSASAISGGTRVAIQLSEFPNCPILPADPGIAFGGVPATFVGYEGSSLIVTAPPHAAGSVDVTVSMCGLAQPLVATRAYTYFDPAENPGGFRIVSIAPSSSPIAGGTRVAVQLNQMPNCPILPIGPPAVLFGGVAGSFVAIESGTSLIVTAPPHATGVVDVSVEGCGLDAPLVATRAFTYFDPAVNPNPADYEKVLFPVVFRASGAFGSEWGTTIVATNRSAEPIAAARPVFEGNPMCPAICGCSARADLQPKETNHVCVEGFKDASGLIFYPPKAQADDIAYAARITDHSRIADTLGTEVPVVRERDFRTTSIVLPDVPINSRYRVAMRFYDPDQRDGGQVRMRVTRGGETVEALVTLRYTIVNVQPEPFPNRPAFAFIGDLAAMFPTLAGADRVNIELTPLTQGMRFWAFASITNNETQQVTTATPQ